MFSSSLVERATGFPDRVAIVDEQGRSFRYGELLQNAQALAETLLEGSRDLNDARIAFLTLPGPDYVVAQWAIWLAGGIAVPLAVMHPDPELEFVLVDCEADTVMADGEFMTRMASMATRLRRRFIPVVRESRTPFLRPMTVGVANRRAMIVYTSGSTGKPKGVVTTHGNLSAQITSLVTAWEWSQKDRILLTLPLHHVHGIVNVLGCALWNGATCFVHARFDPERVWAAFCQHTLTLFMAVPTIYRRLIEYWQAQSTARQRVLSSCCDSFRLMVSGSAALPETTLEEWRDITGHTLLERYGMTEIGMALSNPLHGTRRAARVGAPLPGVSVKLMDDSGPAPDGSPGEIHVRGNGVFSEYWNRPQETRAAFDGTWFKTGDIAVCEDGSYRILGRQSVDIIKTGGYKVSALEIEEVLRRHPGIVECAVVGVADDELGERIAVAVETSAELSLEAVRRWTLTQLAPYKAPSLLQVVEELPRNPLGKVVKPRVVELFGGKT